jgi:hypothetical protein
MGTDVEVEVEVETPLMLSNVISVRGSREYKVWLAGLSKATLVPVTVIVRDAVARWAAERGHKPQPPAK